MDDKFNRANLMPTVLSNDNLERDMILSNWDLFEIKRPIKFDTVHKQDIHRPDLLSIRVYGKMSYWWILLKANNIDDVWNDLFVGQDIIVPDANDISDFILAVKKRERQSQ